MAVQHRSSGNRLAATMWYYSCGVFLHTTALSQKPLVVLPADRTRAMSSHGVREPPILPRLVYSANQREHLVSTASKVELFPFSLHRTGSYLRNLAAGRARQWEPPPPALHLFTGSSIALRSSIINVSPRNIIEPACTVKPIRVAPVSTKISDKRRRAVGRGKMSAAEPLPSEAVRMQQLELGLPEVDHGGEIVGLDD